MAKVMFAWQGVRCIDPTCPPAMNWDKAIHHIEQTFPPASYRHPKMVRDAMMLSLYRKEGSWFMRTGKSLSLRLQLFQGGIGCLPSFSIKHQSARATFEHLCFPLMLQQAGLSVIHSWKASLICCGQILTAPVPSGLETVAVDLLQNIMTYWIQDCNVSGHSDVNKLDCFQNRVQSLLVQFQSSKNQRVGTAWPAGHR